MSKLKEIIEILNQTDEHNGLEVKRGGEVGKSILETIIAFSNEPNLGGGTIVLGVEEDKESLFPSYKVVGVDDTDKIQKDLATQCAETFNQPIRPNISIERYQGKNVVLIEVEELPQTMKPVYFKNRGLPTGALRRIGSTDQHCSDDDMFVFYNKEDDFDSAIVEDSDIDDISESAVALYRKLRNEVNPNAEELIYEDIDLLRALNCIKKYNNEWKLTNCGLIVFGKKMALRRLMPMMRVDYIRVNGKTWVENPDERFATTLDLRGPLITLVHRTVSAISDDLPTNFLLEEGEIQAKSNWVLPLRVLREAVVNAFIHRSYRVNQPIQIIRYSNRIEIINAGFSLKSEESIGEPGSVNRNTFIASIFHETNLAETKGTGFGLMRKLMKNGNMLLPTFESSHSKNSFTLRLLLHNFLSEFDIHWLNYFKEFDLSDEQKMMLVFIREVGAIDNKSSRQLCGLSSKISTKYLRDLSSKKLITKKGNRKHTYYIPTDEIMKFTTSQNDKPVTSIVDKKTSMVDKNITMVDNEMSMVDKFVNSLPSDLINKIGEIGQRTDTESIKNLIVKICAIKELSSKEIAIIIGRNEKYIKNSYLKELIEEGKINYTIPEMIKHPNQKYKTIK